MPIGLLELHTWPHSTVNYLWKPKIPVVYCGLNVYPQVYKLMINPQYNSSERWDLKGLLHSENSVLTGG